jgi:hypothetical protein
MILMNAPQSRNNDDSKRAITQEVRELLPRDILGMARFYNVNLTRTPYLLQTILQAVETPLPPNWIEVGGKEGEFSASFYMNELTGETQKDHPADAYFLTEIQKITDLHTANGEVISQNAWLEFRDDSKTFYYNFADNTQQEEYPACGLMCTTRQLTNFPVELFSNAAEIHRQPKMKSYVHFSCEHLDVWLKFNFCRLEKLDILCFHSSWNETYKSTMVKRHADIFFSIRTQHFQVIQFCIFLTNVMQFMCCRLS